MRMEEPVLKSPFAELPMPFELFVGLSRAAASRMEIHRFCRVRRCARAEFCEGRLKHREIPSELSGEPGFTVWLPACIAGADEDWLDAFITYWYVCRDDYFDRPIYPPQAAPEEPPLCEEWPAADSCLPETLWTDGRR